jgi:hypothetical protein
LGLSQSIMQANYQGAGMSNDQNGPRRAARAKLFSVILAGLAVLGLAAAFAARDPVLPVVHHNGIHIGGRAFFVMAMVFGLTAVLASVLVWRMSSWMALAYGVWSVATLVLGVYVCIGGLGMMVFSAIGLWAVICFVLYGGLLYLKGGLAKASGSTSGRH